MLIAINGQRQMSFEQFQRTFRETFGQELMADMLRLFEPANFLERDSEFRVRRDSELDVCATVKELGYGALRTMRLYGEHYEIVSDPFPEGDGVSLQVKAKKSAEVRNVRLPATIVQSVLGQSRKRAS